MFLSRLHVAHLEGKSWELTKPLVWEGRTQYFVIREGLVTDFASVPKPVRWVLDSAGRNSEAAVLHDAVWRESQRKVGARVDPWNADGMLRRALRETGSTALTRGLMWFAVRAAAMVKGRFGKEGPGLATKILQLVGILFIGILTALGPTIVAAIGLVFYWIGSWIASLVWHPFDKYKLQTMTNWPWPGGRHRMATGVPAYEMLMIIDKPDASPDGPESRSSDAAKLLDLLATTGGSPSGADIDAAFGSA